MNRSKIGQLDLLLVGKQFLHFFSAAKRRL